LIIRENLYLLAVFVALPYAQAMQSSLERDSLIGGKLIYSRISTYVLVVVATLIIAFSFKEVVTSAGKPPFEYGSECYKGSEHQIPGWTDGLFVTVMPIESKGIKLLIDQNQPDAKSHPLSLSLSILDSDGHLLVLTELLAESDNNFAIEATLPDHGVLAGSEGKAILKLSRCFTPSNFGIKDDSKKIGVHIKKIEIY
jgi:hypothetical protein